MIMRSRVTAPRAERAVLSSSESLNERVGAATSGDDDIYMMKARCVLVRWSGAS